MRVSQGGHEVLDDKLRSRFSRTLANLQAAIAQLPDVLIYDNSDLNVPHRQVTVFEIANWIANVYPNPKSQLRG
jgi:predicted ABC-type ATPase